jgi:hypothetical protein
MKTQEQNGTAYVHVVSNKDVEDLNMEVNRIVSDVTSKGWKVHSVSTTALHMAGKETLVWNGVLYTATIVFDL